MKKQDEKQRAIYRFPACAEEYIKQVLKKMRYRRKVRQDVQAELAAHFEDELKDCKTDEKREQKAKQLITEFGDVKLLAVLLRRAKKRCRPLWRTAIVRTFQAIGVLILCFIFYVVWFLTGKPVITTNYVAELNNMVRPVADESLNAAPLYIKAIELYEKRWDDIAELRSKTQPTPEEMELVENDLPRLMGKKYEEVTSEQKKRIEKWLTDNKDVFDLVVAGAQKPYHWQTYGGGGDAMEMMSILMPKLSGFRRLAFALRWRAWLNAEQGRFKDALVDMKSCYRLGRHLRGDKTLIEQLVGIAVEALAVQAIRDIINDYQIDSTTLAVFQQDFERMITDEDFAVSFKAEKLFAYDGIQRCFTEDSFGGGHLCFEGLKQLASAEGSAPFKIILEKRGWTAPLHILFTHPDKYETREMVDRCFGFWDEIAHKTPLEIRNENIDTEKQAMKIVKGNILLDSSIPYYGEVILQSQRHRTNVGATLAIIAILRYNQEMGDYPENLAKLTQAGFLKTLPIDPFSDKPLVYKKTTDSFCLYSIGPNFKDDGGRIIYSSKGRPVWQGSKEGGDMVFWPVPKPQVKQ